MEVQTLSPEFIQDTDAGRGNDSVSISQIDATFSSDFIDLISAPLNSRILATSDEWFAPAANLINPSPPILRPGVFVHSGAWMDGWETRRHNPAPFDYVIIRLGVASGRVSGVEIDTAFFDGNQAPSVSIEGCFMPAEGSDEKVVAMATGLDGWEEILGNRECRPNQRHAWRIPETDRFTHVRLRMFPDGGIARFRLYGIVVPVFPSDKSEEIELSAAVMGGVPMACSDQHFGGKANLLFPGRGKNMGDGWETKRSRGKGHTDWVIIKLGGRGTIKKLVIDTKDFRGNFPQAVVVEALDAAGDEMLGHQDQRWSKLLPAQKLGPDAEHEYGQDVLINVGSNAYSHVKMTIIPDGGVKRFRVYGMRT